jgi:ComF family protein
VLFRGLLELMAPSLCAGCDEPLAAPLCTPCRQALPWLKAELRCAVCHEALRSGARPGARCARCVRDRRSLAACIAPLAFEPPVLDWIHRFKYPQAGFRGLDPQARRVVLDLVREAPWQAQGHRADRIVPIPLHPRRLRARGFNPATLLARAVARASGVVVAHDLLARVVDTASQTGLGARRRQSNVAGAFACRSRAPMPRIVWLVDDVVTTGATLHEAARTLRRAGVERVIGVCLARTPTRADQP